MAESSARTVDRALSLLGIVCDRGSVSLTDAARDADLSTSTALRLLRTLESKDFIRRDVDGLFTPGARIVQLGALALSHESLVELASDAMAQMVEQTGESCYLSIRGAGNTALYIAIAEGTHSVRHASWVGRSIPIDGSAAGAALTGNVGPTGYVVVRQGVEDDVTAIAVPIRVDQRVVAALSSIIPSYRVSEEQLTRIGELLLTRARTIIAVPEHLITDSSSSDHSTPEGLIA